MPLSQNDASLDYDGSWGDASKTWPKIVFRTEAQAREAHYLAWKKAKIPYGAYVLVGRTLRLEKEEYIARVRFVIPAPPQERKGDSNG
jgi:hypothetical protein